MSTWRSNVDTLMPKERKVQPNHLDPSRRAPRTNAAAFTRIGDSATGRHKRAKLAPTRVILIAAAALLAACGPNPHPNPVPRVPTPTPEPNREPEPPVNPKTLSVVSTLILVGKYRGQGTRQEARTPPTTESRASPGPCIGLG
jgi:hypothetical protein